MPTESIEATAEQSAIAGPKRVFMPREMITREFRMSGLPCDPSFGEGCPGYVYCPEQSPRIAQNRRDEIAIRKEMEAMDLPPERIEADLGKNEAGRKTGGVADEYCGQRFG